jgi:hypothetical protein
MRPLGFVSAVLVSALVLGGLVHEMARPHGHLSDTPLVTQPTVPAVVHPNDATSDVRDVRERPPVRYTTPTSANTVPAPVGADSGFVPPPATVIGFLLISLLVFAWPRFFESRMPQLGAFALSMVAVAGCATAEPRDAAWARRQIIESECRTWAQSQARAEYAPQIRDAARQQSYFARSGNSAGAGLAGSTVALAQLAQQGREQELFDACLIERRAK